MRLSLILLAGLALCTPVEAAELDLVLVRECIGVQETGHLAEDRRDSAIGFNGRGKPRDRGRYQINEESARFLTDHAVRYGLLPVWIRTVRNKWPTVFATLLHVKDINRAFADTKLRFLAERDIRSIRGLAFGFNGGQSASVDKDHASWAYATRVSACYTLEQFNRKRLYAAN